MKILVANLGSTSFKYRLFAAGEDGALAPVAKGGYERVEDYRAVILDALDALVRDGAVSSLEEIQAVGFKTVLGHRLSGCVEGDDACIAALDGAAALAPAHNPPYAAGIRLFRELLPGARRVALFETAFYQFSPLPARRYAVPRSWADLGLVRHGFHGASHKFIAERSAELLGRPEIAERVRYLYHRKAEEISGPPLRVVSCHLGGSSSITGILDGVAIGTSMGLSPQSGLPQNNRVGDLDAMAFGFLQDQGISREEIERTLIKGSGLLGLSGVSNDLRDIQEAAAVGNPDAAFAVDFLVHESKRWIGGLAFTMGGIDALVFTAGIGEYNTAIRSAVCAGLEGFGICLDPERNATQRGVESRLSTNDSPVQVWTIPASEEAVVAAEALRFLQRPS